MKLVVSVPVRIVLDADWWADLNGVELSEVRADVRQHVLTTLQGSVLLCEEAGAEISIRKP